MDSLPPRFGEAYERVKNAGGRKNRKSSGNLREQVVHVLPTPVTTDGKSVDVANQVATRNSLQLQSITAILDMPKDTWMKTDLSGNKDRQVGKSAKIRQEIELLRTPVASEAEGGAVAPDVAKANGQTLRLSGQMIDLVAPDQLPKLPTPTVSDQYTANLSSTQQKPGSMHSVTLAQVFHKPDLFPTPNTMDHLEDRTGKARERQLHRGGSISRRNTTGNLREDIIALMPTPNTLDHLPARSPEKIAESKLRTPGGYSNVRETVVNDLMPTPTTRDYKDGSEPHERDGKVQTDTVARAVFNSGEINLPTPTASDWKGANHSGSGSASSRSMATVVEQTNWGKFEPAIRRWEAIIGRPAPEPTKPDGKEGNHRLSSKFTEWMMGLPDGWITDIGLKRNDELKACGNGVVPQQAELALSLLGIKEILERN
jgi:hypothetical protein